MSDSQANRKRNDDEKLSAGDEQNRKRLRSTASDLKVIVGLENQEQEVYWHFSQTLASQSGYVDALLSTPLPTADDANPSQKDYREVVFSDITPDQWQKMMQFLTNPLALSSMSIEDALELTFLYDQYDFETGIKICDTNLSQKGITDLTIVSSEEEYDKVEACIQAIVLSEKVNLKKTSHRGRKWLSSIFSSLRHDLGSGFPLTIRHMKQLVPTIIKDDKLEHISPETRLKLLEAGDVGKYFDNGGEEVGFGLKERMIEVVNRNAEERGCPELSFIDTDIASPLFSHLFIATAEKIWEKRHTRDDVPRVRVMFTGEAAPVHAFAGRYRIHRTSDFYYKRNTDDMFLLMVCHRLNQWQLICNDKALYVCPMSGFCSLPPRTGWVDALNSYNEADFRIDYY